MVEPGTVHATLQRAAAAEGLRFGPDPSTHSRCTIGGMIGNNACGSRALGYGRTADNVQDLDVLTVDGRRLAGSSLPGELDALVAGHLSTIRTELGRFTRQVSGYSLEHLLPENGRDLSRFLVGTEGTLGIVLGATVRLVEDAPFRALAVLGYPTSSRRPTPCRGCWATPWSPARAWTAGSSTWSDVPAGGCRTCPAGPAGSSPRSPATAGPRWRPRPPRWSATPAPRTPPWSPSRPG